MLSCLELCFLFCTSTFFYVVLCRPAFFCQLNCCSTYSCDVLYRSTLFGVVLTFLFLSTLLSCYMLFSLCHVAVYSSVTRFNPLNPELNSICYLLALLGAHHFLHVSRIRVKLLTFRLLMSYIYGAIILDVSRSHTTTHHSR